MVDSCTQVDCAERIRHQGKKPAKIPEKTKDGDKPEASVSPPPELSLEDILTVCPEEHLASAEVLVQLLRIQSKYLDEHPCLCTSRFRHVLHQLDHNQHKKLADLCRSLRQLTTVSSEHHYATAQNYNDIILKIFDYESLKTSPYILERPVEYGNDQALASKLEAILARLISDYRAIFAIEEQCVIDRHQKNDEASAGKTHESQRKRHEEEDECPEEIKLMKVAWKDLSLNCSVTAMTASPLAAALGSPLAAAVTSPPPQALSAVLASSIPASVLAKKPSPAGSPTSSEGDAACATTNVAETTPSDCTDFIKKYNAIFRSKNQKKEKTISSFSNDGSANCTSSCKARKRKDRQEQRDEHDSKFSRSSSETWDDSACDFTDCFKRSHSSAELEIGLCCEKTEEAAQASLKTSSDFHGFSIDAEDEDSSSSSSSSSTITNSTTISTSEVNESKGEKSTVENGNTAPTNDTNGILKAGSKKKVLSQSLSAPATPSSDSETTPKLQDTTQTAFNFNGWGLNAGTAVVDHSQDVKPVSWIPTLHENYATNSIEGDQMFASRNLGILNSQRHLDPTPMVIQRRSSDPESSKKTKLKHLKKSLSHVKRKMEDLQISFEHTQGYKPSQADKQGDREMRRLLLQQSQLQRQIRGYRECDFIEDLDEASNDSDKLGSFELDSEDGDANSTDGSSGESTGIAHNDNNNSNQSKDLEALRSTLEETEEHLSQQRANMKRPENLDDMMAEQLHDEKMDLQHAIKRFEAIFGSPIDEEEKSVVKSLYDRYRTVKRLVRRSSASRTKEINELETIPEDEALPLTLASPQQRINFEMNCASPASNGSTHHRYVEDGIPSSKRSQFSDIGKKTLSDSSDGEQSNDSESALEGDAEDEKAKKSLEQYHAMSRYELLQVFRKTREEKKRYRRLIKEKEKDFQRKTGRRQLRDERDKSEDVYKEYKTLKAKAKLIDALLSKPTEPVF